MFDRYARLPMLAAAVASFFLLITFSVISLAAAAQPYTPMEAAALDRAHAHVSSSLEAYGLSSADVAELRVSDLYTSSHNGVTHVYLQQQHRGLDIFNALINVNVLPDNSVLYAGNRAYADLAGQQLAAAPTLAASEAVQRLVEDLGLSFQAPLEQQESIAGLRQETVFSTAGIALEPIRAHLVYAPDEAGHLHLAWQVELYYINAQHWWIAHVDASSGEVIQIHDQVVHDSWAPSEAALERARNLPEPRKTAPPRLVGRSLDEASAASLFVADGSSYRVYAMPLINPDEGARSLVSEPAFAAASPWGWHDTNGAEGPEHTITRGNNVHAYQDRNRWDSSSGDEPDGGPALLFDFPVDLSQQPITYQDAAVVNLFYWNNLLHDLSYVRGFDEAAGNFQQNNYGKGGAGGDPVRAEAQDGEGTNNANFGTPPDGQMPRMQMYEWTLTNPNRDGDFDNGIILHEYGHGISIRQTGGPSNSSCLSHTERAGEGWSDWQATVYTAKPYHTPTTNRGMGTYVFNQPITGVGIRTHPYNTDMNVDPRTYANTRTAAVPHGVGSIWMAMLWEVYWQLVDKHGFNPDFYAPWDEGGNLLAMQLVNDGFKIQPCSPGFVDARDAILAADQALTGGANQCLIWAGFAKRGLGWSASQGSPHSNSDNNEAFDMPEFCQTFQVQEPEQMACAGDEVNFMLELGVAWSDPVQLSATGAPGTVSFSPNPLITPGGTVLNLADTDSAPASEYQITVTGDDGSTLETVDLVLDLFDEKPASAQPLLPIDGAEDEEHRPLLSWTAIMGVPAYEVEIATDPMFLNIVATAQVQGTSWRPDAALAPQTLHYWRVWGLNPCGRSLAAEVRSFRTRSTSLACNSTVDFESGIPADWAVSAAPGGNGLEWTTTADNARCSFGNETNGTGEAACADAYTAGNGSFDTTLTSPPLSLAWASSARLDLSSYLRFSNTSTFSIEANRGQGWQTLWTTQNTGKQDHQINLNSYAGSPAVQLRFRYYGSGSNFNGRAQVDDVYIHCVDAGAPELQVNPSEFELGVLAGSQSTRVLELSNTGQFPLDWGLEGSDTCAGVATGLSHGQDQSGMICISSNDPGQPLLGLPMLMRVFQDEIFADCFEADAGTCPQP